MKRFGKSHLDVLFRQVVAAELASAKKEVMVVTGEFSAFSNYIELQWAVRDAVMRGVSFKIYANSFEPGIARKLIQWGCKLYIGDRRARNHFMVVDKRTVTVSKEHPSGSCGDRHGMTSKIGVSKYMGIFQELIHNGKPVKKASGPNPLLEWLSHPVDLGARTDGARIDLDMYYGIYHEDIGHPDAPYLRPRIHPSPPQ
jgi:hypothetical protein